VINRDALIRFRYRFIPDHVIGELLVKRWMDNAIPFLALVVVLIVFGRILPDFYSISNVTDLSRQFAETGLVVLGLTIVMLSGGIDLSVGSVFGLAVLTASICMNVWNLGVGATLIACLALGIVCGAINGILVGYLRLRAGSRLARRYRLRCGTARYPPGCREHHSAPARVQLRRTAHGQRGQRDGHRVRHGQRASDYAPLRRRDRRCPGLA